MRKYFFIYFLPLLFAITILLIIVFKTDINSFLFKPVNANYSIDSTYHYIENFQGNQYYEEQFLLSNSNSENIFLLGSSELGVNTEATPYNFITKNFKTKLRAVGHAGNQCFSIYSQLLANENRLNNAPIVIILSPGWFISETANGTTASLFLEFNSSRFLNSIINNDSIANFKQYEIARISSFYDKIINPDLSLKILYFEKKLSESFLHKIVYFPFIKICKTLNNFKLKLNRTDLKNKNKRHDRLPITSESVIINWDSLFTYSKQKQIESCTNNNWFIYDEYFNNYIKGRTSTVSIVKDEINQELKDFKMLVKLLKTKKTKASFIILPINPYYYRNSNELTPLIKSLDSEITLNNFPCLNFWNADSTAFDNGILTDIMHLSSYGWYKVDKFIIETYNLAK